MLPMQQRPISPRELTVHTRDLDAPTSQLPGLTSAETYESFVICWRFLERLPLLTIMTKDDQRHVFALDQS